MLDQKVTLQADMSLARGDWENDPFVPQWCKMTEPYYLRRRVNPSVLRELVQANGGSAENLDLQDCVFEGDFEGFDFSRSNLRRSLFLRDTGLQRTAFCEADLTDSILAVTDCKQATFRDADLTRANLERSQLEDANFNNANLPGANLYKCNLTGANFTDANIQGATLEQCYAYRRVTFHNADLREANLEDANLPSADFNDVNFRSANLESAILNDADLSQANLTLANLERVHLSSADLSGSTLISANLKCADLTKAALSKSNLTSADLEDAKFGGAKFEKATLIGVNWGAEGEAAIGVQPVETREIIYRSLKNWHQGAGRYDEAGRYFYYEMDAKRQRIKEWKQGFLLFCFWQGIGYGEKPQRALRLLAIVVFGFAIPYFLLGLFPDRPHDFSESLYFSAVSTISLGYGGWVGTHNGPAPYPWATVVGTTQSYLGATIVALFLVTIVRKMTR